MNPAVAYITPFSHPSHPSDEGAASVFIGVFAPLHPFSGNFLYVWEPLQVIKKLAIAYICRKIEMHQSFLSSYFSYYRNLLLHFRILIVNIKVKAFFYR